MDPDLPAGRPLPRTSRTAWIIIGVLGVLGVIQGLVSQSPTRQPTLFDEARFRLYATNLADRGFYGDEAGKWPATVELRSVGYSAYVAPGYPFFLAAFRKIIGGYGLVRVGQALIAGATVAVAALLANRLFGLVAGAWAGVLLLATWVLATYSRLYLSEVLATGTLMVAVALAVLACDRRSWALALGAGAALGISALVRPQVLLLPIPLGLWAFLAWGKGRAGAIAALALVAGVVVTVGPWTARNYARLDAFVPVSSYTWITFWLANNPGADGNFRRPESYIGETEVRRIRALPEVEQDAEWRRLALEWVRSNPGKAFRGWLRNGRVFLTKEDAVMRLYHSVRGARWPRLDERWLVALALAGIISAGARRTLDRRAWPLLIVAGYFMVFFCFFLPEGRFRVGMLPSLAVLASALPAVAWGAGRRTSGTEAVA